MTYGMDDAREGAHLFYQHTVPVDRNAHAVERYLLLVRALGIPMQRPLSFPLPTGDRVERFDEDEAFVLLHPFARGQRKSLSDLAVEEFCHALAPHRIVIVGRSKRQLPVPDNCINLLNHTTLLQLIWLMRRARFTISVDSGPMHIAAALSGRLISIHTWSDPRKVGPYNPEAWVWKSGDLMRVRELSPAPLGDKSRLFKPADVRQLLAVVRQHL
jgi:heptosyltransferase I